MLGLRVFGLVSVFELITLLRLRSVFHRLRFIFEGTKVLVKDIWVNVLSIFLARILETSIIYNLHHLFLLSL